MFAQYAVTCTIPSWEILRVALSRVRLLKIFPMIGFALSAE